MTEVYKIPEEILSKIPEYFWTAFAGELVSVFGPNIFEENTDDGLMGLDFLGGTSGWSAALEMTCRKLELN